jgi:hypothetical protein
MAVDVDLLLVAKEMDLKIVEKHVEWSDQAGSKVRFFYTSSVMFLSVFRLFLLRFRLQWLAMPLLKISEITYRLISGRIRIAPPGSPDISCLR